jgi:hypothetical protein
MSTILDDSQPVGDTAPDPFSPEALRLPQDFEESAPVKRVLTIVPVRKPGKQEFVRVRPGVDWRIQVALIEDDAGGDVYAVAPALAAELAGEWKSAFLFLAITSAGDPFLWRCWVPQSGGGRQWHESAIDAVRLAETAWARVRADQQAGYYKIELAAGKLAEPTWPEQSFRDLLKLAFRDRLIDSLEHPFLKQLRGES